MVVAELDFIDICIYISQRPVSFNSPNLENKHYLQHKTDSLFMCQGPITKICTFRLARLL